MKYKQKFFECYSHNLTSFLIENGVVPKRVKMNENTKKTMWLFERNEDLDVLLTIWSDKSNLKK